MTNPNQGTKGTKEINKNYPSPDDSGLGENDYHVGRQINLVAEGFNNLKTTVSKETKKLL